MASIRVFAPESVSASTRQGLTRKMARLQINNENVTYKFFDIQYANGEWVAWYNKEIELLNRRQKDGSS